MESTINISGLLPGLAPVAKVTKTAAAGLPPVDTTLAAGKAGSLSTRTNETDGTLTMSNGHGITNGQVVSIFWVDANGDPQLAYGATVGTVATNSVPFTGAAGTALPAQATAVVVDVEEELDIDFDGDKLVQLLAVGSQTIGMQFVDSGDAVLSAAVRAGNEPYLYLKGISQSNPLTGNPVDAVRIANGSSANSNNFKMGGLYEANT